MVGLAGTRHGTQAFAAALVLLTSCTPDSTGIQRLPFEPSAAPSSVTITPEGTSLGFIGQQLQLTAQVLDGDGKPAQGLSFVWSSANAGVVAVDKVGNVTAVAEGSTRIYARVVNLMDSITVSVKRFATSIVVSQSNVLFTTLGATASVTSSVVDGGGQALSSPVDWTSTDTALATVSAAGVITAVGQGSATIRATSGGVQASVSVKIRTGPADVLVAPRPVLIDAIGDQVQLAGAVLDAAGDTLTGVAITYGSADVAVATVDATGLITATGIGVTTVVATGDTVHANISVSVTQTPASVVLGPVSGTLIPGGTLALTASVADRNDNPIVAPKLTWSSSDVAILSVSSTGVATGVAAGTATVTATAGGFSAGVELTVVDVPTEFVDVTPSTLALKVGATSLLSVSFFSADSTQLHGPTAVWSSADPAVATVNAAGLVTAVGVGTASITATSGNGTDSSIVTVTPVSLFNIEVRFVGPLPTAAVQAAFAAAEVRWEELIVGDLPNQPVSATASQCGIAHGAVNETVDDLLIFAEVAAIDGSGGILGQAGPCVVRATSGLAALGTMQFDQDDLADLLATDDLGETILHEMGHVLGLGASTPWENTLVDKGGADPYWPGTEALIQYGLAGGASTNKVPVANTGSTGTRDAHWREAHMGRELMTGFINTNKVNPLSAITLGAMKDMGYVLDLTKADAYTVSAFLRSGSDRLFELREVPMPPPQRVNTSGRVVR